MNIFHAEFGTGQVIKAAGVSNASLQTWLRRGVIVGHRNHPIESPGSPGYRRSFSFFNVMEIATAKALVDVGLDLSHAFHAGAIFAHTGDTRRLPSLPFTNQSFTLLCVAADRATVVAWQPGKDILANIRHSLLSPLGYTILEMNPLFDRVVTSLGYHPSEVLDHARPKKEIQND